MAIHKEMDRVPFARVQYTTVFELVLYTGNPSLRVPMSGYG